MKFTFTLPLDTTEEELKIRSAKELKCKVSALHTFRIVKRSIDARHKKDIKFVFSVEADTKITKEEEYQFPTPKHNPTHSPIIVGFGPAGIFCAYVLAKAGYCPIVLERGEDVDTRKNRVNDFLTNRKLNENSNVQFGEGGAGAFSDGKLNTGIGDSEKLNFVLRTFAEFGGPKEILYEAKPHIGTDLLTGIIKAIREKIIQLGGKVIYNSHVTDIIKAESGYKVIADKEYFTDNLVLAIGHSASDTYRMLVNRGFALESKAFSVGIRAEHLQTKINQAMYGDFANHPKLSAADYKVVSHTAQGDCYSFCMCPGGEVIASSSEKETVVTNGMSYNARSGKNANSAILVGVDKRDYGEELLGGLLFREKLEKTAYIMGGSNYNAPCQLLGDFFENRNSKNLGEVLPTYKPDVTFCDFNRIFSSRINDVLKTSFRAFGQKIEGFDAKDVLLTGVETRSSAPLRVIRDKDFHALYNRGIYPCGEGCGYAGGIMSAAVDGIRVAEAILTRED